MRTTRSKGRKDAEKDQLMGEDNYLQGEYITNLQQQIYFLELELQVMKEKQQSGRFAGKALSSNVPLDTHMNSLRDKYMSMEKKFKKKIRKMEQDAETLSKKNEELTMRLDREGAANEQLSETCHQHEEDRESAQNARLAERLRLEKKVEKLEGKLAEKNALYESISDKFREFRVTTRTDIDALKDDNKALTKELAESAKDYEAMETAKKKVSVQLVESEENVHLKSEELLTLRNENFAAKDTIRGWEHKHKKLEMDIEQEKEVSAKYERENQSLRKQILELEAEIKDEQKKLADINKSEQRWSGTLVELRHELEKSQATVEKGNESIAAFEARVHQMSEDHHRLTEQMADVNDKLSQATEALTAATLNLKKMEDANLELRKDNMLKSDVVDRFDAEKERMSKEIGRLRESNELLQVEGNALKQKLNVSNKLENINLDEFKTLCSTNLRVADSIKTLMSTINITKQDLIHSEMNDE